MEKCWRIRNIKIIIVFYYETLVLCICSELENQTWYYVDLNKVNENE